MWRDVSNLERDTNEFLLRAAQAAKGDIEKRLSIEDILKDAGLNHLDKSQVESMVTHLRSNGLIRKEGDTISLTYEGIYYISNLMNYPIESLGILSEKDIRTMINTFNDWISRESLLNPDNKISIGSIKEEFSNVLGEKPIIQLLHVLENKGVIQILKDDYIKVV